MFNRFKNAVLLLTLSVVLFRAGAEIDAPAPVELSPAELHRRRSLIGKIPRVEIVGLVGKRADVSFVCDPIHEKEGKLAFDMRFLSHFVTIREAEKLPKLNMYYDFGLQSYNFTNVEDDPRCLRLFFGLDEAVPQFNPDTALKLTFIGAVKNTPS